MASSMPRPRSKPSPQPDLLATALVEARRRSGRSQADIAAAANVSQVTISSWERGEQRPRADRLDDVAVAYGLRIATLRSLWFADAKAA